MDDATLKTWIGRTETRRDITSEAPLQRLAALLDYASPPWTPGEVPPLGHWLNFLPQDRQSDIDHDGHAKRGGFLPPITLPRRMWAGSRLTFEAPIRIGSEIERRSEIIDVAPKTGASGKMILVKVRHEVFSGNARAIVEEHDIVYRDVPMATPSTASASKNAEPPSPTAIIRSVTPDPVQLFRFSALTFNGHRIHYDRDHAREEGYPGLIVHGPLIAVLLMDHYRRNFPSARVTKFNIRFQNPVFDIEPFDLCLDETASGADLRAINKAGKTCATASIEAVR